MKILIVTPLYPPDLASHAPYVKEFATRMASRHTISILTYGHIPETIPNVSIHHVPKRLPAPLRILRFTMKLAQHLRTHDIVFLQNGPSVELPFIFTSFIMPKPAIFRLGDTVAFRTAQTKTYAKLLLKAVLLRTRVLLIPPYLSNESKHILPSKVITASYTENLEKPEISPFIKDIQTILEPYEKNWNAHIEYFEHILKKL